jgi:hypothetical protein
MPTTISDGRGTGSLAKVTDNRLQVESNTRPFLSFKAKASAEAFALVSTATSGISAGNFIFNIKYTGTGGFVLTRIAFSSDQIVVLRAHKVTGTAAGSTVTPRQLNFGSAIPAGVTAVGDGAVTGLTSAYHFLEIFVPASIPAVLDFDEVPIITTSTQWALEIEAIPGTSPTRIATTVWGYESDLET